MAYYSFVAIARQPVGIPNPLILLDTGVNTFTAETNDLDGLLAQLEAEGVNVTQVNKLDDFEEVTLQDLPLLPAEASLLPPLLELEQNENQADS